MTSSLESLMPAIVDGDERAFAQLHNELRGLVKSIVRKTANLADPDDVAQVVFLRVWREAWRFDGTKGSVRGWVSMIARNAAIDASRAAIRRGDMQPLNEIDQFLAPEPPCPLEAAERFAAAWAAVPVHRREMLNLAARGTKYRVLADYFDCPVSTIKSAIFRTAAITRKAARLRSQSPRC